MPTGDIAWSASPSERINAAHGHMAIITRQAHLPPVIKLYLRRGGGGRDALELAAEQLLYIALQKLDPRVPLKVQRRSHRPQVPLDRTFRRQSDSDANLPLTSIYLGITIHATALQQRKRPVLRMNAPPCTAVVHAEEGKVPVTRSVALAHWRCGSVGRGGGGDGGGYRVKGGD